MLLQNLLIGNIEFISFVLMHEWEETFSPSSRTMRNDDFNLNHCEHLEIGKVYWKPSETFSFNRFMRKLKINVYKRIFNWFWLCNIVHSYYYWVEKIENFSNYFLRIKKLKLIINSENNSCYYSPNFSDGLCFLPLVEFNWNGENNFHFSTFLLFQMNGTKNLTLSLLTRQEKEGKKLEKFQDLKTSQWMDEKEFIELGPSFGTKFAIKRAQNERKMKN